MRKSRACFFRRRRRKAAIPFRQRGGNSEFRIPNSELIPLYSPLLAGAYSLQRAGNT